MSRLELIGKTFGKLDVKEFFDLQNQHTRWRCVCVCGHEVVKIGSELNKGLAVDCGKHRKYDISDLTGQTFGKIKVLEFRDVVLGGSRFLCRCDCGVEKLILGASLKAGKTKTCGNKGCRLKSITRLNLNNQRFGKLVVLNYEETRHGSSYWKCQCDCGNTIVRNGSTLKSGRVKRCKCTKYLRRVPAETTAFREIVYGYARDAIRRGYTWELDDEYTHTLLNGSCFYCGTGPSNELVVNRNSIRRTVILYSGIDRVDNTLGYTKNNTVSACFLCNGRKQALSYDDFMCWIKKIAEKHNLCGRN